MKRCEKFVLAMDMQCLCPVLAYPQTLGESIGGIYRALTLHGASREEASFIVDACNLKLAADKLAEKDHADKPGM